MNGLFNGANKEKKLRWVFVYGLELGAFTAEADDDMSGIESNCIEMLCMGQGDARGDGGGHF